MCEMNERLNDSCTVDHDLNDERPIVGARLRVPGPGGARRAEGHGVPEKKEGSGFRRMEERDWIERASDEQAARPDAATGQA